MALERDPNAIAKDGGHPDVTGDVPAHVFEILDEGVAIFDSTRCLIRCNEAFRRLFPKIQEALIPGTGVGALARRAVAAGYIPRSVTRYRHGNDDVANHRNLACGPAGSRIVNGRRIRIVAVPDGGLVLLCREIVPDICELPEPRSVPVESLARAREAEARLRTALDTIPEGIFLFDADDRLVHYNETLKQWFPDIAAKIVPGMTRTAFMMLAIENNQLDIPPDAVEAYIAERLRKVVPGGTRRDIKLRNGRWIEAMDTKTADGGSVTLASDITDRMYQEAALRDALAHAEAANLAKTQFLANTSHELRTPLNAILGFSEIMRDAIMGPIPGVYSEYAANIHESGRHLLNIINDILDLSKLTLWSFELHEEVADPRSLVESCALLVRTQMAGQSLIFREVLPNRLPRIRVDVTRIKQVLLNLLSNAKKYTGSGGTVTISTSVAEDGFRFIVSDTGIGMAPADIPLALEAFRRVGDVMNRTDQGTGLGLPLAKAMTEAHGGVLTIDSQIGIGTTVTVLLPPERVIRSD